MSAVTPELGETASPIVEAPRAWRAAVEGTPTLLETLHPQLWSTETPEEALQPAGYVLSLDQPREHAAGVTAGAAAGADRRRQRSGRP